MKRNLTDQQRKKLNSKEKARTLLLKTKLIELKGVLPQNAEFKPNKKPIVDRAINYIVYLQELATKERNLQIPEDVAMDPSGFQSFLRNSYVTSDIEEEYQKKHKEEEQSKKKNQPENSTEDEPSSDHEEVRTGEPNNHSAEEGPNVVQPQQQPSGVTPVTGCQSQNQGVVTIVVYYRGTQQEQEYLAQSGESGPPNAHSDQLVARKSKKVNHATKEGTNVSPNPVQNQQPLEAKSGQDNYAPGHYYQAHGQGMDTNHGSTIGYQFQGQGVQATSGGEIYPTTNAVYTQGTRAEEGPVQHQQPLEATSGQDNYTPGYYYQAHGQGMDTNHGANIGCQPGAVYYQETTYEGYATLTQSPEWGPQSTQYPYQADSARVGTNVSPNPVQPQQPLDAYSGQDNYAYYHGQGMDTNHASGVTQMTGSQLQNQGVQPNVTQETNPVQSYAFLTPSPESSPPNSNQSDHYYGVDAQGSGQQQQFQYVVEEVSLDPGTVYHHGGYPSTH